MRNSSLLTEMEGIVQGADIGMDDIRTELIHNPCQVSGHLVPAKEQPIDSLQIFYRIHQTRPHSQSIWHCRPASYTERSKFLIQRSLRIGKHNSYFMSGGQDADKIQ